MAPSTTQDFAPGQSLPALNEDQPCATESVVQVTGETFRVGSSEALCDGSYLRLLGHPPGKSVTGSPAEAAMHEGALTCQLGDGAPWAVGPPAPAWLSGEAAPQPMAGCTCVRDCQAELPR